MLKMSNPPINEVVFGVIYPAGTVSVVDVGLYWEQLRADFPLVSEHEPIIDLPANIASPFVAPRTWLQSAEGSRLIQLQSDRFHYNWRQLDGNEEYPSYAQLKPDFLRSHSAFIEMKRNSGFAVSPIRFELTYTNIFDKRTGWSSPSDFGRFVKLFTASSFLDAQLDAAGANLKYSWPNIGSFYVSLKQGVKQDRTPIGAFELTFKSNDCSDIEHWFDSAHDSVISAFKALTTEEAHKVWGITS